MCPICASFGFLTISGGVGTTASLLSPSSANGTNGNIGTRDGKSVEKKDGSAPMKERAAIK